VIDYANRLLPEAAPDVRPSRSVRESGRDPVIVPVTDVALLAAEVAAVVTDRARAWRTVGVVLPEALDAAVRAALPSPLPDTVLVVSPPEAKGLEFDAVVVVEPALFAAGGPAGLRLLYIALTRAVQELTVIHAAPLPPVLASATSSMRAPLTPE
jgi:DNA helicase IV